jgi:hypothetical protein
MGDRLVIEERDWSADCEVDEKCCYTPADSVCQDGPGEQFELPGRKQTHIEEQNRGFNANQSWRIGPLECKVDLVDIQQSISGGCESWSLSTFAKRWSWS